MKDKKIVKEETKVEETKVEKTKVEEPSVVDPRPGNTGNVRP